MFTTQNFSYSAIPCMDSTDVGKAWVQGYRRAIVLFMAGASSQACMRSGHNIWDIT